MTKNYFELIDKLPVDYIDIGYRSELKEHYLGEYFYLPISTLKHIKKATSKKLSVMLNAKDCDLAKIKNLLTDIKGYVTLIRIATDPNNLAYSLKIAKLIKKIGFDVAINVMYISNIDESHIFFDSLKNIEEFIDILYLVDSFGSINPEELETLISRVKNKTNVNLGFHGHNNLELAFINTLKAISCGAKFVDSTILGMGRGAGNLKTELILTHLKSKNNLQVDLNLLGKLTELFIPLGVKYNWGTNLAYMVSGSYSFPQKDVMSALELNRYSLSGVVNQLQNERCEKMKIFTSLQSISRCLIIGGGQSVCDHIDVIKEFLALDNHILVIHSTSKYLSKFQNINNIQYFAISGDELLKVKNSTHISKYILEPYPRKVGNTINYSQKFFELENIDFPNEYSDSPLAISLQITKVLKTKEIFLAGFDGYEELKSKKELYLMQENQEIIDSFIAFNSIISLTPTKYKNLKSKSIYGMVIC